MTIFEVVRQGKTAELRSLLEAGEDIHQTDENGWTLLSWAAGRGDLASLQLLVEKGVDVQKRGRDNRTPYMIALAAGHREIVKYLKEFEERGRRGSGNGGDGQGERRPYCKAYLIGSLQAFPGWPGPQDERNGGAEPKSSLASDGEEACSADEIVFLHEDYTVTRSVIHGQSVIFAASNPEWRSFCRETLKFKAPTDLDLLPNE